jgi:hypothetical protein
MLLSTFNGPVATGATLALDLGASSLSGDGTYSFVISSSSGNDVWFGSSESSLSPILEVNLGDAPPPPPAPVDGQASVCYKARTPRGSPKPDTVLDLRLEDPFEDKLFDAKKPRSLCAPAETRHASGLSPLLDASTHFESYRIRRSKGQDKFDRSAPGHQSLGVVDQFGVITVDLIKPEGLLVPSAICDPSAETCPANAGGLDLGSIGQDHFKCYKARVTRGTASPRGARSIAADRFQERVYEVKKASRLCAPVNKDGQDPQAVSDPYHLMCYLVRSPRSYCSEGSPSQLALSNCASNADCGGAACIRSSEPSHGAVHGLQVANTTQLSPEVLDLAGEREICVPALRIP